MEGKHVPAFPPLRPLPLRPRVIRGRCRLGLKLWSVRLLILPHMIIGVFMLGSLATASIATDWPRRLFYAFVWNLCLSFFVYYVWVVPLRQRSLYKRGRETHGEIMEVRAIARKSMAYFKIAYRYSDDAGRIHLGSVYSSAVQAKAAAIGQRVRVLYSDRKPSRSVVYELGLYAVLSDGVVVH